MKVFLSGKSHDILLALHEKYGPVVRTGPNELSFIDSEAWDDIFGRPLAGKREENSKASSYISERNNGVLGAPYADHSRMRRLMSNGFSAGAMAEQQPKIEEHIDLLLQKLKEKISDGDDRVDMCAWYNYVMFDIIGELALGEPFGCLQNSARTFTREMAGHLRGIGVQPRPRRWVQVFLTWPSQLYRDEVRTEMFPNKQTRSLCADCNTSHAYAEMRLILARMVWNFDIVLPKESQIWLNAQSSYIIWEKAPLFVRLGLHRYVEDS